MRPILLTALAFCAFAGVASAAPVATDGEAVTRMKIALDAAARTTPTHAAARFARGLPPGIARTSLETRFKGRDEASGEAGLLCGLQPHPDQAGAAAAFGHDPDGKFVGAKLKLSF
jgi:hypothetical protein